LLLLSLSSSALSAVLLSLKISTKGLVAAAGA